MKSIRILPLLWLLTITVNGQIKQPPVLSHSLNQYRSDRLLHKTSSMSVAYPETSINILAVMVEFQEDSDTRTTGTGKFDISTPSNKTLDASPHDRAYFKNHLKFLENYFRKASNGKLVIKDTLLENVFLLPHTMRYYSPPKNSATNLELGYLMKDTWGVIDAAAQQLQIEIPYDQYNTFIIFHAGAGRDIDLISIYADDPTPFDIPSLYIDTLGLSKMDSAWSKGFAVQLRGVPFYITNSIIIPETENREQVPFPLGINGLLVASIGSRLGLPDLFNTNNGSSGIGRFGLMDGQSIFSWNGAFPPEPSAWEKNFLGWIQPITISFGDSIFELPAVSLNGSRDTVYKVLISAKEYFLIENRNRDANQDGAKIKMFYNNVEEERIWTRDSTGFNEDNQDALFGVITDVDEFDWSLPGGYSENTHRLYDGGLLIWHIDETVIEANRATNTVNANPNRRGVNLMEADGSQDIGQSYNLLHPGSGSTNGTVLDFWYRGNNALLRTYLNAFTPTSHPNTQSNSGADSHIYIGNTTQDDTTGFSYSGPRMKARIRIGDDLVKPLTGFPKNLQRPFSNNSISAADLNGDGQNDILVATRGMAGVIAGWQTNGKAISSVFKSSGFLVDSTYNIQKTFFGKPAIADINGDQIQDFGIINYRSLQYQTYFNYYSLVDINFDSLADDLTGGEIILGRNPSMAISDSFYFVLSGKSVLVMNRSGNQMTSNSLSLPSDSSFISGICIWKQPDKFVLSSYYGEIGIFTSSGMILSRNLSKELPMGVIAGIISPAIGKMIATASNDGLIYLLDENLNVIPNFPFNTHGDILNSPALADIDGDGQKDIIVFSSNKIFAINANGFPLDNYPITVQTNKTILASPIIADIDANGTVDIIAVSQEGLVLAYDKNGMMATGFPILAGINNGSTPAAFYIPTNSPDIINIGLAVASDDGYMYAWRTGILNMSMASAPIMPWPQYMHDARNAGLDESLLEFRPKSNEFFPSTLAYNWPNPVTAADGFKTYIRYYVREDAKVHIKIFDPAGDLVAEFDGPGRGGFDNEAEWDVSKIQSGVYFGHIEASGSNKNGYAVIKIAVVK